MQRTCFSHNSQYGNELLLTPGLAQSWQLLLLVAEIGDLHDIHLGMKGVLGYIPIDVPANPLHWVVQSNSL